jgi:hypothetical protein
MDRKIVKRTQRQAVLAAIARRIARREWLIEMLALGAAAGCRRGADPAYSRGNTLVMAYPEKLSLRYDDLAVQSLYLPRLAAKDQNGRKVDRPQRCGNGSDVVRPVKSFFCSLESHHSVN